MFMHWLDWVIVIGVMFFFVVLTRSTRKYMQCASDFLAADRVAGRYLLTMAENMAGIGAISIIAMFQMYYKAGFGGGWWGLLGLPVALMVQISGWIIYRYRETRVLTMAEFFGKRYSSRFRVFAGSVCYISGILNFGIFPAVAANFFITYCGFPQHYAIGNVVFPTYHTLLIALIVIPLYFTLCGGQISVLLTDFFQSFFCSIVVLIIIVVALMNFPLREIFDSLLIAEKGKSMVNPFDAGKSEFNSWYFVIGIIGFLLNRLSWQGTQAFNASAKSPHEAKMAGVLAAFRNWGFSLMLLLLPLVAYTIMHNVKYVEQAKQVTTALSNIENSQVRDQMLVPVTMKIYMPLGVIGAFAAVMLMATIGSHQAGMHSWGSIFVQDVYLPLRNKSLTTGKHLLLLRLSIVFVAVFAFLFSSMFRQTQDILMFFAFTGAIWMGGAGAVIIGGLYTRWGTTMGAYAAMIVGMFTAVSGMICDQLWMSWFGTKFFLTGQEVYFFSMVASVAAYIFGSLFYKRSVFDLDKLLHRGQYSINGETCVVTKVGFMEKLKTISAFTPECSRGDRIIIWASIANTALLCSLFIFMTIFGLSSHLSDRGWSRYHRYVLEFNIVCTFIIFVWLTIGGFRDVFHLFRDLKVIKHDPTDDGQIHEPKNILKEEKLFVEESN